jgi:hypothetical protein
VTRERRLGWLAVLAGGALSLSVQLAAPVGVPLYDGVVVQEPYRYLHPTGSQAGAPASYDEDDAIEGGASPAFAAATSENPPQVQLIAQTGAFTLSAASTSIHVSIAPIDAPAPPSGGSIAGNVYRVLVTDQAGTLLNIAACDGCLTLSMRAPQGTDTATIERYANGAWTAMETLPVGIVSIFQTDPTVLGDIAIITGAPAQPGSSGAQGTEGPGTPTPLPPTGGPFGIDPLIIFGVTAVVLWLLVFGFIVWQRVRPAPPPGAPVKRARDRIPPKQRPPRRPGSGRPNP